MQRLVNWFFINLRYAFKLNKPLFLMRLIKNYLGIIFLKKRLLRYVDFAIGYKCNLKCEHCFAVSLLDHTRRVITPLEYGRAAKKAMELGALTFSFQGGEPLLYPSLEKYIKAANPRANLISVTTNGTLLNHDNLEKLKKWGVDILTVSLDSGIPDEHDKFRNREGSFFDIICGIKRALNYGFNVTIGTVVTSGSLRSEGIARLIDLSRSLKVILMLIQAVPVGRWKNEEKVLLNKEDLEYLENLVLKNPYVRTDFDANYFKKGCGALKEILYINPYGDVFVCPFIHKSLGNILIEPLNIIRGKALKNDLYKDYHNTCIATIAEVYSG